MKITVQNEKAGTTTNLTTNATTVKDLLVELAVNSETVLVTRNNEILTEDELLNNDDTIEILSVVSGG